MKVTCEAVHSHVESPIAHQGQAPLHVQHNDGPQIDMDYDVSDASLQLR